MERNYLKQMKLNKVITIDLVYDISRNHLIS